MIRHIVLIRFKPEADATALLAPLAHLTQKLNFTAQWGRSESPEQIERGYLHGFTADFTSWAHLAHYAADPDHQTFGAALVANATGGIDGILVFDLAFGGDPSLS
jgi:hypothetical protein